MEQPTRAEAFILVCKDTAALQMMGVCDVASNREEDNHSECVRVCVCLCVREVRVVS